MSAKKVTFIPQQANNKILKRPATALKSRNYLQEQQKKHKSAIDNAYGSQAASKYINNQSEANFLSMFNTHSGQGKEQKNIQKQAQELIKSFQTPEPRFIKLRPMKSSNALDSIDGDDETQAYFKPQQQANKQQEKQERLINFLVNKSPDPRAQQIRFINDNKKSDKEQEQFYQRHRLRHKSPLIMKRNSSVKSLEDSLTKIHQKSLLQNPQIQPLLLHGLSKQSSSNQLLSRNQSQSVLGNYRSVKNLIKLSPRLTFKNGMIEDLDDLNALTDQQISNLYKAKCEDLSIPFVDDQFEKFKENCKVNSINRRLKLQNFSLGPKSASTLANIIATNHNFSQFNFSDNFLGNDGIVHISNALMCQNHIIKLDLSNNDLSHEGTDYLFNSLTDNQSLIELNLASKEGRNRNRIHSKGCLSLQQLLMNNQFLSILNISGNCIKNEGLKLLCDGIRQSGHKTLTSLDVSYNEISQLACDFIHELLIDSNLLEINLRGNVINNQGVEKICQALYFSRSKLTHLNLADCNISFPGAIKIFDAVKHNYQLTNLILDNNPFGSHMGYSLTSSMMSQNRSLIYLSMSNCQLDDTLAVPLGDGLHNNIRLTTLDLSHNEISDEGAISIASALQYKSSLISQNCMKLADLNLSRNKIGDTGGEELAKMIGSNKTLVKINLSFNSLADLTGSQMIKSINHNDMIQIIDLSETLITLRFVEYVNFKCRRNKFLNIKNQVPSYIRDLEYLRTVKTRFEQIQERMIRAQRKQNHEGAKYQKEVSVFDKIKSDQEKKSQQTVEELTYVEKYNQKLSNDQEELDKVYKEIDNKLFIEDQDLRQRIANLQANTRAMDINIHETKEKIQSKSKAYKSELQLHTRQLLDTKSQLEVLESKVLQMKAERLVLLKEIKLQQYKDQSLSLEQTNPLDEDGIDRLSSREKKVQNFSKKATLSRKVLSKKRRTNKSPDVLGKQPTLSVRKNISDKPALVQAKIQDQPLKRNLTKVLLPSKSRSRENSIARKITLIKDSSNQSTQNKIRDQRKFTQFQIPVQHKIEEKLAEISSQNSFISDDDVNSAAALAFQDYKEESTLIRNKKKRF